MNCVECNKELQDNAKFCRFCGASQALKPQPVITPTVSAQPSTEPACKKCGNLLFANAKFCKHCGESTDNVTPTAPPPPVTSIKTNQNTTNDNQIPVNNLAVPKNKNWLIPTLILFTVFIISALVYVLKFSGSSDAKQPSVAVESNSVSQPAIPPQPATIEAEPAVDPTSPDLQLEADQATDAADQQKLADEEKEATRLLAVEQARVEHEEKLQKLQEQAAAKAARAEELKKARTELAAAKLEAKQQEAKLAEEQAQQAKVESETAQNVQATSQPAPSPQATFKTKFKGFLGVTVTKREYPTQEMKDKALQIWKSEGKVLELDGSLTSLDSSSNPAADTIMKGN